MVNTQNSGGSAKRWGTLFGTRTHDWAETCEGPSGDVTKVAYLIESQREA